MCTSATQLKINCSTISRTKYLLRQFKFHQSRVNNNAFETLSSFETKKSSYWRKNEAWHCAWPSCAIFMNDISNQLILSTRKNHGRYVLPVFRFNYEAFEYRIQTDILFHLLPHFQPFVHGTRNPSLFSCASFLRQNQGKREVNYWVYCINLQKYMMEPDDALQLGVIPTFRLIIKPAITIPMSAISPFT